MTLRELHKDEWSRLDGWELAAILPFVTPEFTRVLVVEDAQGQIIGAQGFMSFVHWHGLQIAPEHRGKGAVLRSLLGALTDGTIASDGVLTGAINPEIDAQLKRLGAVEMGFRLLHLSTNSVKSVTAEG